MRASLAALALSALAVGCGTNTVSSIGSGSSGGATTTSTAASTSTSGGTTGNASSSGSTGGSSSGTSTTGGTPAFQVPQTLRPSYPAEPSAGYDLSVGRISPNLQFTGYVSATAGTRIDRAATQGLTTFSLQDLRNLPRPSGAPFKYLLLDLSAGWCGPCNNEAESYGLNGTDATKIGYWLSRSGLFVTVLVQNYNETSPAPPASTDLTRWLTDHGVQSNLGGDVGGGLFGQIAQGAFPANLVINLDTMQVEAAWYADDPTQISSQWEAKLPPQ